MYAKHPTLARSAYWVGLLGCAACTQGTANSEREAAGDGNLTDVVAIASKLQSPFDACPSPKGDKIYFTAMDGDTGGLFAVAATGGDAQRVATGFFAPVSLVVSTDGNQVFVADLGAEGEDAQGAIQLVSSGGGNVEMIAETVGFEPQGLDLRRIDGKDVLFFTGRDPKDQRSAVFAMDTLSREIRVVFQDEKLSSPSGVAVAADGSTYVVDSDGGLTAASLRVYRDGELRTLVPNLRVGFPAGIALTQDEAFVLVSALREDRDQAAVYRVDVKTGAFTVITKGIEGNSESAGVHRAHEADRYAWANADYPGDESGGGTVYLLGTKAAPLAKVRQ